MIGEEIHMTEEAVALVEANARLLIDQAREAKLAAARFEAALALVVGVVANDPDLQGSVALQRIAGQIRLCADLPDLAAETIGCDEERVCPNILRAAAEVLGDVEAAKRAAAADGAPVTLH
ncbi:hypothetical protein B7G68_08225 [Caulobacter segnis]|uniref:Uncharacterized protein n=3 Tax=Caulobacter segnis TaxID=88688 RepID=D5VIZ8_CAUST|nr:hypothetical protein Cseg_1599 [Caulobacter segnis ATCC 21756]AVQ01834.1 hypothetical protein B7G68_08225 [Caulobacter segnis]